MRAGALFAAAALVLVLGLTLVGVREDVGKASTSLRPTPSSTSVPSPVVVSRQSVLSRVRGLETVVSRAQRYEAKLVSSADLRSANLSAPAGSLFWVVAVSGDVHCDCVLPPTQPLRSALFLLDPHSGSVLASARRPDFWPEGFEALPDHSRSPRSRTVEGFVQSVNGNVVDFQVVASPERLRLIADENTAYSWSVGMTGGSALTIEELAQRWDLLAGVTFDAAALPDGTYRLEALRAGIATK